MAIHDNLDESITDALPGLHFFTGNDYISASKALRLKALMEDERFQYVFGALEINLNLTLIY